MSISLLAAAVGALAAVIVTGILAVRYTRAPRIDLAAWPIASAGLAVALAADALGAQRGFGPASFRAVQVGAQLVAPLGLVWALAEVTARSVAARFAARLGLAALTVVGGVILGTDPLAPVAFSTAWPSASVHYQPIPHYVLAVFTVVVVVSALASAVVAGARSGRDQRSRHLLPAALAGAGAALLTQTLRISLPVSSGYAAVCLTAVVLTWAAGRRTSTAPHADLYDEDWDAVRRYGSHDEYPDEDAGYDRLYRDDTGGFREMGADTGYGFYRPDTGAFAVDTGGFSADTGYSLYRADSGLFAAPGDDSGSFDRFYREEDADPGAGGNGSGVPGMIETGYILGVDGLMPGLPPEAADPSNLYGQITIYTLYEGQADEFDQLAKSVVEQVKAREPATLVYVMHGVPSAPLQRILYEVYQDADAFAEHERQPYIAQFAEDRTPYVLATNVIELGLQQAKVSPFPSIADLFGEPGYDTSGFERPDYTREYGSSSGRSGAPS